MLSLHLLGGFAATVQGKPLQRFHSNRVRALLVYLALESDRAHSRDRLATLLWGSYDSASARTNLRIALSKLGKQLNIPLLFITTRQTIQLDSTYAVVDALDFARGVNAHLATPAPLGMAATAALESLLAGYQGEFLAGFALDDAPEFDEWRTAQQEQLHQLAMQGLDRLQHALLGQGDFAGVLRVAQRQLALEPWYEPAHRSIIEAYARQGNRAAAFTHYEACCRVLLDTVGLPPDEETMALVEQIQANALPAQDHARPALRLTAPAAATNPIPDPQRLLARLETLPAAQLFGVDEALARVEPALRAPDANWLLALDGMGGLGKTTLADRIVRRAITAASLFADVAWVTAKQETFTPVRGLQATNHAALTEDALLDQLLAQLADGPYPTTDRQEKQLALTKILHARRCLVVIDNLETAVDTARLLPLVRRLANPSKFLLTSRYSLAGEGDIFSHSLQELSDANALALLRHEAERRGLASLRAASDAQLAPIYETVGGNPLALKLVIGQLQVLPLGQILNNLRRADTAEVEQFYTYLYWQTWQMLDDAGRHLLLALPIVPKATFVQLQAASGLAPAELQTALRTLRNFSLVEVVGDLHEPRYTIHRLTETFLLHEVVKWHEPTLRTDSAEAQFFVQRVLAMVERWRTTEAVEQIDVTVLDHEYAAVLKAIALGLELPAGWPTVKTLILAVTPYMERRGHWQEWTAILERAIAAAPCAADFDGEITLTALLARLCQRASQPYAVVRHYRQAIRLARRRGNRYEEARACSNLGYAFVLKGQWWRAEQLCHHALTLFLDLNSTHGQAHTHNHLGVLYTRLHRLDTAITHLQQACALWEAMGDNANLSYGYNNLGMLYLEMEQPAQALPWLQRAYHTAQAVGDHARIALFEMNLGVTYYQSGQLDEAEDRLKAAEGLYRTLATPLGLAQTWGNLGEVYLARDRLPEAEAYLQAALETYRGLGNVDGELKTLTGYRRLASAHGNQVEATLLNQTIEQLRRRQAIVGNGD
jgi:DNA-binding SARP family transcriptional activator/Flp pilus assembly protein TadD